MELASGLLKGNLQVIFNLLWSEILFIFQMASKGHKSRFFTKILHRETVLKSKLGLDNWSKRKMHFVLIPFSLMFDTINNLQHNMSCIQKRTKFFSSSLFLLHVHLFVISKDHFESLVSAVLYLSFTSVCIISVHTTHTLIAGIVQSKFPLSSSPLVNPNKRYSL